MGSNNMLPSIREMFPEYFPLASDKVSNTAPTVSFEPHSLPCPQHAQDNSQSIPFPTPTVSKQKYRCEICGKAFQRPSSLTTHTRSHTGEKPYVCAFSGCGKRFPTKSNMLRHYRSKHLGSKT